MTNESLTPLAPALQALPASSANHGVRHDGWTGQRQRAFCETLAETGRVDEAARTVGMARETAYRLRRRAEGRAFGMAWDAALLLARQRMIDDAYELAFEGSVERIIKDGKVIAERRRRDPNMLLATIERLGSSKALGTVPTHVIAQEFETFLDCLENDANQSSGASAKFMADRAKGKQYDIRIPLETSHNLLRLDMKRGKMTPPGDAQS